VPSLKIALISQLAIDTNDELDTPRLCQVCVLARYAKPIPEGNRQSGGTTGQRHRLGQPFQRDRPSNKWNRGPALLADGSSPTHISGIRITARRLWCLRRLGDRLLENMDVAHHRIPTYRGGPHRSLKE
jgi:hypothetical protein